MKKKVINNLIILEFAIFISIVFIAVNLILWTNYFDDAVLNSRVGMLKAGENTDLYAAQKEYQIEEKNIDKQKIKTAAKPKQASKADTANYFSDFNIAPTKKIDEDLKKEVKKKKRSKEKVKIILEAKSDEELRKLSEIIKDSGGTVEEELTVGNSIIADVPADKVTQLSFNDGVEGIFSDKEYNMLLDTGIYQINAPSAWDLGYNGAGVKIAVLDTGIDGTNEMLSGKVVAAEVFTGENHTEDKQGHGTHIAGIIAGNGKYKGVAPGALLMNAKVLTDAGSGSTSTIIKGINWAVKNGADVISMSLGGAHKETDGPLNAALKEAIDLGTIVVISAGNCGEKCPSGSCGSFRGVTKPGDFEEAITVGAVDKGNEWACFSSGQEFGNYIKPDLAAPGVDITSSYLGNTYHPLSGTSMSAPFVAGVAALMLQKNSSLNPSSLKSLLESNAVDLGVEGKDVKYGAGLVDVGRLLDIENEIIENNTALENETEKGVTDNLTSEPSFETVVGTNLIETNQSAELEEISRGDSILQSQNEMNFDIESCSTELICGGTCYSDCSNPDYSHWNCKPNSEHTCCQTGYPYYNPNTEYCTNRSSDYGCSSNAPYYCYKGGGRCFSGPSYCDVSIFCGGQYRACIDVNKVPNCKSNGNLACCPESEPYYWESDGGCHPTNEGVCGDNVCDQNEDLYSCEADCKPELKDYKLDPSHPTIKQGDSLTFKYRIYNPSSNSVEIGLGASVRDPDGDTINDENNDDIADVSEGTRWYSRPFDTNSGFVEGDYDAAWGIHKVNNGEFNGGIEFSNPLFEEDAFTITQSSQCGNSICEEDETKSSCPNDCYSDVRIVDFVNPPAELSEGQQITINVKVKNEGSLTDTSKIEVGIIPKGFFSSSFEAQSYDSIGKCCPGNEYYAAKNVTLDGNDDEEIIPFTLYAPSRDSIDHCSENENSAWNEAGEFEIVSLLYDECFNDGGSKSQDPINVDVSVQQVCSSNLDCVGEFGEGYK